MEAQGKRNLEAEQTENLITERIKDKEEEEEIEVEIWTKGRKSIGKEPTVNAIQAQLEHSNKIASLEVSIASNKNVNNTKESGHHLFEKQIEALCRLADSKGTMNEFEKCIFDANPKEENKFHKAMIYYFTILEANKYMKFKDIIAASYKISEELLYSPIVRTGDSTIDIFQVILMFCPDTKLSLESFLETHIHSTDIPNSRIFPKILLSDKSKIKTVVKRKMKKYIKSFIQCAMENESNGSIWNFDEFSYELKALCETLKILYNCTCEAESIKLFDRYLSSLTEPYRTERIQYVLGIATKFIFRDLSNIFHAKRGIGWFYFLLRADDISQYYFNECLEYLASDKSTNRSQELSQFHEDLGYAYSFIHKEVLSINHFTESVLIRSQLVENITDEETASYYFNYGLAIQKKGLSNEAMKLFMNSILVLKDKDFEKILRSFMDDANVNSHERSEIESCIQRLKIFFDGATRIEMLKKYSPPKMPIRTPTPSLEGYIAMSCDYQNNTKDLVKNIKAEKEPVSIPTISVKQYTVKEMQPVKQQRSISPKHRIFFPIIAEEESTETNCLEGSEISSKNGDRLALAKALKFYTNSSKFMNKGYQFIKVYEFYKEISDGRSQYSVLSEHCNESLESYFRNNYLLHGEVMIIVKNLVDGFLIMKQKRYVHGNINDSTLFVNDDGQAKIGDLGSAKRIEDTDKALVYIPDRGKLEYLSPEMLVWFKSKNKHLICYPCKSDVFSLGLTLLKCCGESIEGLNNVIHEEFNLNDNQMRLIESVNTNGFSELDKRTEGERSFYYSHMNQLQEKIENALLKMTKYQYLYPILARMLVVNLNERINFDGLAILVR